MPDLSVKRLSESEYPLWDSFVESSPQGTIFNTSTWAFIIREVLGVQHGIYAVLQGDELVGGFSFFHKKKAGLKVITRVPLTPYNGILFHASQGEKSQRTSTEHKEIIELILQELEKEFNFIHFVLHPSIADLRPFLWRHWYTLPQYTYVNSLTDISHTWELLSSSLRRKINRAEENRFKIIQKDDPTVLLRFQELSYARAGMKPILSLSIFKRVCDAVARPRLLRIYSIVDAEANVHAERAILVYKDRAYDWIAGTNLEMEDEHANHLLVWEIFKRLSDEGVQTFDFLGANTPSVVEFKRSFGGELICYFEVRYFSSPLVHTLNFLNQRWRHWQRST